jgi:uncharacterized protein (DUF486 family)
MNPVPAAILLLIGSNVFIMNKSLKLDYLWAALCILGAVYFIFRSPGNA